MLFTSISSAAMAFSVLSCAKSPATESADPKAALIAEALSAAPDAIAATATVMNWDGAVLREGSADWVCYPSMPDREGVCPMCLDPAWQKWLAAFAQGEAPEGGALGVSYMLRGDCAVSNIDPMAMHRTDDNEWVQEGPHVMLLAPDASALAGMPHDPDNGGPYVMWRDTPYAHIMVPLPAKE